MNDEGQHPPRPYRVVWAADVRGAVQYEAVIVADCAHEAWEIARTEYQDGMTTSWAEGTEVSDARAVSVKPEPDPRPIVAGDDT